MNALRSGDKAAVNISLKPYKHENGSPNFRELISIPNQHRLPELSKQDPEGTAMLVVAGLTLAMENMNLKRGLTPSQLADLAEEIIDTSVDDKIAMEDLMLFLQRLTRGTYGELYESMDIPKFMNFFNQYRDERWAEGVKIRDEKDAEYKNLGDPERVGSKMTALDEHLSSYTKKLQAKNDEIRELREERKRNR